MSKRLQVLVDQRELREIRRAARTQGVTVAEWVRTALRSARRQVPASSARHKIEAVRRAARFQFPTADIDQMLREIDAGYEDRRS